MAKIFVVHSAGGYRITLKGRLMASDLGRLEHACGSALVQKLAPLELNVEQVLSIDQTARGYLDRLRARGARIQGTLDLPTSAGNGDVDAEPNRGL